MGHDESEQHNNPPERVEGREALPELLDRLVIMAAQRGDRRTVQEIDADIRRLRDEAEESILEVMAIQGAARPDQAQSQT